MAKRPHNLHDRAFKALFSDPAAAWPVLKSALPPAVAALVDEGSLRPGPTNVVDDEFEEDHRDLVFTATIRGRPVVFYVFEHQSQPTWWLPLRLLKAAIQVWDWWRRLHPDAKQLPAVVPVALLQGAKAYDGPRSIAELIDLDPADLAAFEDHIPALSVALQDLGEGLPQDLARFAGPPFVRIALTFFRAIAQADLDPLETLEWLRDEVQLLLAEPGGSRRFRVLLRYTYLAEPGVDAERVSDAFSLAAGEQAGEAVKSIAENLMDAGRRAQLKEQLLERFGALPPETEARLEASTTEELQLWGKRFVRAETLDEVFADA